MPRFSDRTKRLTRRQESNAFRHYIMPVSWFLALAGLLGLACLWLAEGMSALRASPALPIFASLVIAPMLVLFLRFLRGHFNAAVRDL